MHKHIIFLLALEYLQQKDKGLLVLDAFAGIGHYDLTRSEPQKTGEYLAGIAKIMDTPAQNTDLLRFQSALRPFWDQKAYAGSPLLAATLMRLQDRLIANELHPEDVETLKQALKTAPSAPCKNIKVTMEDAYQCIRAHIPPIERRGIVLVDPPFEKTDEFEQLVSQMEEWKRRWATGCFMIWYPIKAGQPIKELHKAATRLELNRTWVSEILLQKRDTPDSFNGSGMLVFNTPFGLPEKLAALQEELCSKMGQGWIESRYLFGE